MRVRCVPRVCAALCVVCCAVRCECVSVFIVFVCGFEGVVRVCVSVEREGGDGGMRRGVGVPVCGCGVGGCGSEEREEERVCGGGKGGDGRLHNSAITSCCMQQLVVACNTLLLHCSFFVTCKKLRVLRTFVIRPIWGALQQVPVAMQ